MGKTRSWAGAGLTSGREQNEMQLVGRRRTVVVVGGAYCHQFSSHEEQRHHGKDKVVGRGRGRVVKQGEEGSRKVPVMRTAACPKIGDDNRSGATTLICCAPVVFNLLKF